MNRIRVESKDERTQECQQTEKCRETGEPSIGSGMPRRHPEPMLEGVTDEPVVNAPPEYMRQFMYEMRRSQQEFMNQPRGMWEAQQPGEEEYQEQGAMEEGALPQPDRDHGEVEGEANPDQRGGRGQRRRSRMFLDYCKASPPEFTGDGDPIKPKTSFSTLRPYSTL